MLVRADNLKIRDIGICYLKKSHLPSLKNWRNRQMDILRQNRLLTDSDQTIWYAKVRRDRNQVIFSLKHGVCGKDSGKFIGYCGITNIDAVAKRGEISFLVNPILTHDSALYRDIFLKTLYLLLQYGFEKLRLREIFTETYLFRDKHIKILEEFGFRRKNILKKRKFAKRKYWDSVIHLFNFKDWHEKKHKINKVIMKKKDCFIITGASRGLGGALAAEIAQNEALLFLIARSNLNKAFGGLNKSKDVKAFTFDLTKTHSIGKLMDRIFQKIDMDDVASLTLINNAGVVSPISFAGNFRLEQAIDNLSLNCIAPIILSNIFIDKTKFFKGPKMIVNISSGASRRPIQGWSLYCSSKAAVEMFSGCAGEEQSKISGGVKILTFDPGIIDTRMQAEIRSANKKDFPDVESFKDSYKKGVLCKPEIAARRLLGLIKMKMGKI